MMKYFKWTVVGIGVLGFILWIASAALVVFWDESGPLSDVGPRAEGVWIFPGGYTDAFESVSWEGESDDPPDDAYREKAWLQRGPLDREEARFPLTLRFSVYDPDAVAAVDLMVTTDTDWADDDFDDDLDDPAWRTIARASLAEKEGWTLATVKEAWAPASACAYRVAITRRDDEPPGGFSKSIPTAPTLLGRIHDRIAWWPAFRWLPDLR